MTMLKPLISATLLALTLGAASFFASSNASADFRSDMLKAADPKASGEYVRARFLKQMKKPFNKSDSRPKAILVGHDLLGRQ